MAWSVVSEESSCFPLALWLTKCGSSVAVSLCCAQDPRPPFTESLGLASHCAFFLWTASAPGVLPSRHSSVPSAPGSTVGTLEAPLSLALFGFLCRVCCGASLQFSWSLLSLLLPVVFPEPLPAAQWSSRSQTHCPCLWPGDLQGDCTPTTDVCQ